ncbi:MAG: type I DNA topoisomerase [Schwartzia sp.]|nr:type I DNA topoisomerase [Schwartzia sp. (in: firmicutes)]
MTTAAKGKAKKAPGKAAKRPAAKKAAKRPAAKKAAKPAEEKTLVVVESPAKAKTIEKYLGKNYVVRASMGHLRDLPKSQFGIDIEHNFEPKYINIRGKGDLIRALKKDAKDAARVYLASDPDREGEAIAWHLAHLLEIAPDADCRIVFNEITKPAIQEAIREPHRIDVDRVDAQQARRMLDRIVGYKLSPLLWRKVRKGLSAGRVQSVTVRMICDREKEVQSFVSEEYWTVDLKFRKKRSRLFTAELSAIDGKKPSMADRKTAFAVKTALEKETFTVTEVKRRERQRKAAPPFNTSSLQQDAARRLGFTSRKTMMLAQQLYEGIGLGRKGPVGLITYMRTDSTRISQIATDEARGFISGRFGTAYVPAKPNVFVSGKNAQDAHEAIRPTSALRTPEEVGAFLTADQLKLYTLIWQRFVACQMVPAVYDTLSVGIAGGKRYACRASGSVLKFPGFTAVYAENGGKKEKDVVLPELAVGDVLDLSAVQPEQHFTEPPPRYNEASLVKTLEEKGIGRPSTYAPIIETIIARGYVVRVDKTFRPTELGEIVVKMLEEYFKEIVDVQFTAALETELDEIADGKRGKNKFLSDFYVPFEKTLEKADEAIGHVELPVEESDVVCELCGRKMVVKQGRYGKFLACPGFPECRNTKPFLKDTGAFCPRCGGSIVERRTRRGRIFYGCKNYPECDFVTWDTPETEPCKTCGSLVLRHHFKNGRMLRYCVNDDCKTRVDHPINKELERLRARAAKAEADGAAAQAPTKQTATKAAAAKKSVAKKIATKAAAAKKTAAKKAAAPKKPAVGKTAKKK